MPRLGLVVFCYMLCFASSVFAAAGGMTGPPVIAQYHLGSRDGAIQAIYSLNQSPVVLPATYRVRARVRLKTGIKKRLRPVGFFRLVRQEPAKAPVDSSNSVFTEIWPPGSFGVAHVPYEIKKNNDSFNDADKLVVDYEDIYPDNPTKLQLKLTFRDQRHGSTVIALSDFTDSSDFEVMKSVDCLKDGFEPRSKTYLARRELGLPGGSVWQYVGDGNRTVLQRRFRQTILDRKAKKRIVAMNLYLRPGSEIERINFAVKVPGWPFACRKIINGQALFENLVVRQGEIFVRVNLEDYLSEFDDLDQVVLDEVVVFFKGKPGQVMRRMPIEKLDFLQGKLKEKAGSGPEAVQTVIFRLHEVKNFGLGRKQLVLDIGKLKSRIYRLTSLNERRQPAMEYRLCQVEVIARPKNGRLFGGIHINRMFTADNISVHVPVVVSDMRARIKRWGGPFPESLYPAADNRFAWLNILDYHSFFGAGQSRRSSGHVDASAPADQGNGLLLQADNPKLYFKWSTKINLSDRSRFILLADIMKGRVNSVLYIFTNREGKKYQVNGLMNKPVRLPAWLNDVASVEVEIGIRVDRIVSDNTRYALLLKKAVFFEPTTITRKELWDAPLPSGVKHNLVPVSRQTAAGAGGMSDGFFEIPEKTSDSASGWRTLVDRPVGKLLRLEAVANIPRRVFEFKPCWLEFTVHGARHSATGRLCFSASVGNASLGLDDFLRQKGFGSDETVRDISWKVSDDFAAAGRNGLLRLTLTENFASFRTSLANEPLFVVNGGEYLPEDIVWGDDTDSMTVDYGKVRVEKDEPRLDFSFITRPYFEVKKLTFARTEAITSSQWQTVESMRAYGTRSTSGGGGSGTLIFKLFFVLAAAVLVWAGARFGVFALVGGWGRHSLEVVTGTIFLGWRPSYGWWLFFWGGMTLVLYALGFMGRGHRGENYFFTFGGIAAVLAWRVYILRARGWLREHRPGLAALLYGGEGSHYFAGAIVLLVITAFFVAVRIEVVAEQVAVIVYYMLVAGVFCALRGQYGKRNNGSVDQ